MRPSSRRDRIVSLQSSFLTIANIVYEYINRHWLLAFGGFLCAKIQTENKSIAVVDSNGKITAKVKGTCHVC